MSTDQIVGISILVIGLVLTIVFGFLTYYLDKKKKAHANFYRKNKESSTIWEFTVKNFPIFLTLFFAVVSFSGLMMLVS